MPILSRCCCCDIRNGCIATAIYSIIYAALAIGAASYIIHEHQHETTALASSEPLPADTKEKDAMFIATCVDIAFFSLLFIFSVLLLYGVKNYKRYYLLPYVVVMSVLVILQTILIILLLVLLVAIFSLMVIFELLVVGFFTFINVYCILCVISQYQDLRDGRSDMRAVYRAQGTVLQSDGAPGKASEVTHVENSNFVPSYPGPPPSMGPYPGAQNPGAGYPPPTQYPYPPTAQPYPAAMPGAQGEMPPPPYQAPPQQNPAMGPPAYPPATDQQKV